MQEVAGTDYSSRHGITGAVELVFETRTDSRIQVDASRAAWYLNPMLSKILMSAAVVASVSVVVLAITATWAATRDPWMCGAIASAVPASGAVVALAGRGVGLG